MRAVIHIAHRTAFAFKLPPFEPEVACCDAKITRSLSAVSSRTSANRDIKRKKRKGEQQQRFTSRLELRAADCSCSVWVAASAAAADACCVAPPPVEAQQGRGDPGAGQRRAE